MRKIYTLLAMVAITGMVMAQKAHVPIDCEWTDVGIEVDGVVDAEWENADAVLMEVDGGDVPYSLYEASFRILWNETNFFMLCQIDDDDHCDQWCTTLDDWLSDRLEIFIDTGDPLDDGHGAQESMGGANTGHRQNTSFWFEGVTDTAWLNTGMWYHYTPFWSAFVIDMDYFDYEFGFIWDEMFYIDTLPDPDDTLNIVIHNGAQVGLQVTMVDVDQATSDTRTFCQFVEGDAWTNMDSMGVVTLVNGPNLGFENASVTQSINVYPTPANDVLYIEAEAGVEVRINNIIGQEVLRIRNYNGNPVDLSGFSTGLYYVSVYNNDGILLGKNKFSVVK